MARPTTWRRSFNLSPFPSRQGNMDLLIIQPDETLGGTWWQYTARSISNVAANSDPPMRDLMLIVGLIVVQEDETDILPMNEPFRDWLWWELVTFDFVLVNNIDFAYQATSNTGGTQRKVKAMRKNDTPINRVLRIAWQTFDPTGSNPFGDFQITGSAEGLIILP